MQRLLMVCLLSGVAFGPRSAQAYSVQTHEQLIDLSWKQSIEPILLSHYPGLTPAQLREAHAYAYGGSAIQDLGYYPFGNKFFSDLTHYVRSGDFVQSLLRNAKSADELAFAIGALAHYVGDSVGHAEAVNPSVATMFPQLEQRFGPSVTYDENPHDHVRVEFAFDINEISKRRFAPSAYLRHVGLRVAQPLLARAFYETYGLKLTTVVSAHRPIVRGYRFSVRSFLPRIAYSENVLHRSQFPADLPGPALEEMKRNLAQAGFENGWDPYRKNPGIGTYALAGLISILPKVGVLSELAIRGPVQETELRYVESLNQTTTQLRDHLHQLRTVAITLPNRDLDTGALVQPGGYALTDATYAKLLQRITSAPAAGVPNGVKRDLVAFYSDPAAPIATKTDAKAWRQVQAELVTLACMPTRSEPRVSFPEVAEEGSLKHISSDAQVRNSEDPLLVEP